MPDDAPKLPIKELPTVEKLKGEGRFVGAITTPEPDAIDELVERMMIAEHGAEVVAVRAASPTSDSELMSKEEKALILEIEGFAGDPGPQPHLHPTTASRGYRKMTDEQIRDDLNERLASEGERIKPVTEGGHGKKPSRFCQGRNCRPVTMKEVELAVRRARIRHES